MTPNVNGSFSSLWATLLLVDVIEDFQTNGVAECVNGSYRKVPNFVAGITNLYGVYDWEREA